MRITRSVVRSLALASCGAGLVVACSSGSNSPASSGSTSSHVPPQDGAASSAASGADAGGRDAAQPADAASAASSNDGSMEAAVTSCPAIPFDASHPADASCVSPDDTDRDGVPDCLDGCPYDGTKIAPGFCGCNMADVDSDGDGVPDCIDLCPHDPNNTTNGQCGCVGEPGLQPAGTACTDTACPQAGATCDGAGVCGDRTACVPCPGGRYVTSQAGRRYWLCGVTLPPERGPGCAIEDASTGTQASRADAQSACAAKGLTLTQIGSLDDNRFLVQFLTAPAWIGANDLQTPGSWYWSSASSDSATLFWSGAADGSRDNGLFTYWSVGAPSTQSCAVLDPKSGRWIDTDCTESLGYVCQAIP